MYWGNSGELVGLNGCTFVELFDAGQRGYVLYFVWIGWGWEGEDGRSCWVRGELEEDVRSLVDVLIRKLDGQKRIGLQRLVRRLILQLRLQSVLDML